MRSTIGVALLCVAPLAAAGCYCSHAVEALDAAPAADAGRDALPRVPVTGCEDPTVWTAPVEEAIARVEMGGGPCWPAQYPLHAPLVTGDLRRFVSAEEQATFVRSCWRATEAHDGSGWTAGDVATLDGPRGRLAVIGFERPVRFEGRVLRDDGTVAFAIGPDVVALDPAEIVEPDADGVVAVMRHDAWAERDRVHVAGDTWATEEVVGGAADFTGAPATLHRGPAGFTLRYWRAAGADPPSDDLVLGVADRALLAHGGSVVALDDELLIVASEDDRLIVRHRVALPASPLEIVGRYHWVVAHVPGALIGVRRADGAVASLAVAEGTLLFTDGDRAPVFFDGESFVSIRFFDEPVALEEHARVRPAPGDLEALGRPLSAPHGVVLGENGFLLGLSEAEGAPAGPRFASVEAIFGPGRIAYAADDGVTYAIERPDGTTVLYRAPHEGWCD